MNKNKELFTTLTLYFALELHNQSDEKVLNMQKEQKKNRDSLLDDIAKILLSYTVIDSAMSLTLWDNKKLYSKLGKKIDDIIMNELKNEVNIMKDLLSNTCLEKYSTNNYIYSLGTDFKLTQVPDKVLDKIINEKIKGELWSDRLWSNKNEMAKDLKVQVKKFLKGGININEIEGVIKTKYNGNATTTSRLVRTEITKVQSGANEYWASKNGIEKQLFMATLDNKTSEICRSYDGQEFDIDDGNKPVPPLHPYCRSCLVNLPRENWKPKMRRDNITKENINWTTYKEWFDSQES